MKKIEFDKVVYEEETKVTVHFCELPDCEHCGQGYTSFGPEVRIEESGLTWCLGCASCEGIFTEEEENMLYKNDTIEEIKYHEEKIKELRGKKL